MPLGLAREGECGRQVGRELRVHLERLAGDRMGQAQLGRVQELALEAELGPWP